MSVSVDCLSVSDTVAVSGPAVCVSRLSVSVDCLTVSVDSLSLSDTVAVSGPAVCVSRLSVSVDSLYLSHTVAVSGYNCLSVSVAERE